MSEPISLFVHSTGTTPSLWALVPEEVTQGTRRLTPANLGYPPNPPVPRGTPVTAAMDVDNLLVALAPYDVANAGVHVYSHSYGGFLALELAKRLGPAVKSLFLLEPVLFGALANARDEVDPAATAEAQMFVDQPWFVMDPERGGTAEWLEIFIDYWNRPGSWAAMPEAIRAGQLALGWKMFQEVRACLLQNETFDRYAFTMPITFALSERTPAATRAMTEELAKRNPHGKRVELAKTGHMAPLTHPSKVHEAMLAHARAVMAK